MRRQIKITKQLIVKAAGALCALAGTLCLGLGNTPVWVGFVLVGAGALIYCIIARRFK